MAPASAHGCASRLQGCGRAGYKVAGREWQEPGGKGVPQGAAEAAPRRWSSGASGRRQVCGANAAVEGQAAVAPANAQVSGAQAVSLSSSISGDDGGAVAAKAVLPSSFQSVPAELARRALAEGRSTPLG